MQRGYLLSALSRDCQCGIFPQYFEACYAARMIGRMVVSVAIGPAFHYSGPFPVLIFQLSGRTPISLPRLHPFTYESPAAEASGENLAHLAGFSDARVTKRYHVTLFRLQYRLCSIYR